MQTNSRSFDRDGRRLGLREAVVARPFELDRSGRGRHREEGQERIGGDRRREIGAEYLLAVVAAHESGDDVARNERTVEADPKAGLHRMGDQRLDLDDLARLRLGRHIDEGARRHCRSSMQAAMVTMTSASSDQNEPSLSCATATIVWASASLMRVESAALPARGPKYAPMTLGCGFFSLNR